MAESENPYEVAERRIEEAGSKNAAKLRLSLHGSTSLPEKIGKLRKLKQLYVFGDKQITTLPESMGQLTGLERLEFEETGLKSLPEFFRNFTALRELRINNSYIQIVPAWISEFTQLRELALIQCKIRKVPAAIGRLRKLRHLNFAVNPISTFADALEQLSSLDFLWLYKTHLKEVPNWIKGCTQLTSLSLAGNQIRALPDFLGDFKRLRVLVLNENRLESLPDSFQQLKTLDMLFLQGNPGLNIPRELLGSDYGESKTDRNVSGGPLIEPAHAEDILQYYFRSRGGRRPLNEAKLILVGRGGAGKSSLIKRLIDKAYDKDLGETPGIEIKPWEITLADGDKVRLHVWDFGGQEILHATHQFFLTERTVYLLVLSGREGSPTNDAEYWLQLIRSFGGDSSVIIALNKSKLHPFEVNGGLLMEKYPQIVGFIKTDCAVDGNNVPVSDGLDSLGAEELRRKIFEQVTGLEHRKTDFPSDWFAIKERLASMKENFVTWDEYQRICSDLGEHDPKAQRDLAGFLHILGIALNYRGSSRLQETHVLNPRWVTEGIYSILRSGQKERETKQGVLQLSDLARALDPDNYSVQAHEFLLELMEKFQLCFRLPGSPRRYLVPELLGENQPGQIKDLLAEPGLGFRYQYEVLSEGMMPRFIVQTHAYSESKPEWRWRTGVVLEREDCCAVVRADARERRIDIHVLGPERKRRDLLAVIRERFDEQHRDLKGLAVDQRIPVTGEVNVTISYEHLLALEDDREEFFRPEGLRRKVRVAELLNGVEPAEARSSRRYDAAIERVLFPLMSNKHVFLSYCHDNNAAVTQLHHELVIAGETVWWDKDIPGGGDWELEIERARKNAYAVVICFSKESEERKTTGMNPEIAKAIGDLLQYAPGDIYLIPVRLSDCELPSFKIDATRRLDSIQHIDLFPASKRADGLKKLLAALKRTPHHP